VRVRAGQEIRSGPFSFTESVSLIRCFTSNGIRAVAIASFRTTVPTHSCDL
jgi:hypothetical protein